MRPHLKIVTAFFHLFFVGIQSWLNPAAAYSAFSAFPRCAAAMVVFAGFTLRWSGRGSLAYWTPILVSVLHQSEAPIVLVMMIGCDLILRPRVFLTRPYALPIVVGVIVIALRERMLSILGLPWMVLAEALAVVVAIAAICFIPGPRSLIRGVWQRSDVIRLHLSRW